MAFRIWAGPREDRPLDRFGHLINLRTVVWVVGVSSLVLNVIALANLGMLNVLLLLPSLLFSVSLVLGPFLMSPKVGTTIGKRVLFPQVAGWLTALGFYTCVSLLVAQGGRTAWLGGLVLACAGALFLRQGLRYLFYRRRLQRGVRKLQDLLTQAGFLPGDAGKLAQQLLPHTTAEPAKLTTELERAKIPATAHPSIIDLAQRRLSPLLRQPAVAAQQAPFAQNRWVSEFRRSGALASFVLAWFFIVPVPGLFVFTAGQYRFTLSLGTILSVVAVAVALAVAGAWAGVFIQWLHRRGLGQRGLSAKIEEVYRRFIARANATGQLAPADVAGHYAAFTDIQTYMEQRSYAYAQRLLTTVEHKLSPPARDTF
jgi:hypothetical protein